MAPSLLGQACDETQALGAIVWLWMNSAAHRDFPLHALNAVLLPAIKQRQFILVSQQGRPVFFTSWANFSLEAQSRYLKQSPLLMPEQDWNSGDRMWLLDWIAPFGHTRAMTRLLQRQLFADRIMRTLYHRGDQRGLRVKNFHGIAVLPQEARHWFETHPVV